MLKTNKVIAEEVGKVVDSLCWTQNGRPMTFNVSPTMVENKINEIISTVRLSDFEALIEEIEDSITPLEDKDILSEDEMVFVSDVSVGVKTPEYIKEQRIGFNRAARFFASRLRKFVSDNK